MTKPSKWKSRGAHQICEGIISKFWESVQRGVDPADCWVWTGYTNKRGYGMVYWRYSYTNATHISLHIDGRPQPSAPGNLALHGDCSNPRCVNPMHLRWGTHLENMADQKRLGRHPRKGVYGDANPTSKLSDSQVLAIFADPRSQRKIAAEYNISHRVVGNIKSGRRKASTQQ